MPDPATALPFITTTVGYFSPAKSPYYAVVAAGTVAVCLVCEGVDEAAQWWTVSIPLYAVLLVSVLLSFTMRPTFGPSEYRDSLRFSRSMGVSTALVALAVSVREADVFPPAFFVCYGCCLARVS